MSDLLDQKPKFLDFFHHLQQKFGKSQEFPGTGCVKIFRVKGKKPQQEGGGVRVISVNYKYRPANCCK